MSFPILVSHMDFIETIAIPTVYQIPIFSPYIFAGLFEDINSIRSRTMKINKDIPSFQYHMKNIMMMKHTKDSVCPRGSVRIN